MYVPIMCSTDPTKQAAGADGVGGTGCVRIFAVYGVVHHALGVYSIRTAARSSETDSVRSWTALPMCGRNTWNYNQI